MELGTITLITSLPSWPPPADATLVSRAESEFSVALDVLLDGRLSSRFVLHGCELATHVFGPVDVSGHGPVHVSLTWTAHGREAHLYLNAVPVPDADLCQRHQLTLPGALPSPLGRMYRHAISDGVLGRADRVFLDTVIHLDEMVDNSSEHSLILAAGRMRLLALDSTPLVHRVNQGRGQKLSFEVWDFPSHPGVNGESEWIPLDPAMIAEFSGAPIRRVSFEQFLSLRATSLDGTDVSVRAVIKACANAKGGVHFGGGRDPREVAVLNWDDVVRAAGMEPSLLAVAGICRIFLRGLGPLVNAIRRSGQ